MLLFSIFASPKHSFLTASKIIQSTNISCRPPGQGEKPVVQRGYTEIGKVQSLPSQSFQSMKKGYRPTAAQNRIQRGFITHGLAEAWGKRARVTPMGKRKSLLSRPLQEHQDNLRRDSRISNLSKKWDSPRPQHSWYSEHCLNCCPHFTDAK